MELFNVLAMLEIDDDIISVPMFPREIWHDGLIPNWKKDPKTKLLKPETPHYHILIKTCIEIAGFMGQAGCHKLKRTSVTSNQTKVNEQMIDEHGETIRGLDDPAQTTSPLQNKKQKTNVAQPVYEMHTDVRSQDVINLQNIIWEVEKDAIPALSDYYVNATLPLRQLARQCIKTVLVCLDQKIYQTKTVKNPDKGSLTFVKWSARKGWDGAPAYDSPDDEEETNALAEEDVEIDFHFWNDAEREHSILESDAMTLPRASWILDHSIAEGGMALIVYEAAQGPLKCFPVYINERLWDKHFSVSALRTTVRQRWNEDITGFHDADFRGAFVHPKARCRVTQAAQRKLYGKNKFMVLNTAQLIPWWKIALTFTITIPDDWDLTISNPKEKCEIFGCFGPWFCNRHFCHGDYKCVLGLF